MSDLSIDSESPTPNLNNPVGPSSTKDLLSLNIKSANEKRGKFGKVKIFTFRVPNRQNKKFSFQNLSVEGPTGSFIISDTEDEPLIASNLPTPAPSPAAPLTASAQNSPLSKQKQFLPPKSSPKLLSKSSPSPQNSPRTTRIPPVAFFMGSDASVCFVITFNFCAT